MAQVEEQYHAVGAQLIWVLQENTRFEHGTAADCRSFMDNRGRESTLGWCVGDAEIENQNPPGAEVFNDSPFAIGRGYDLIVSRRDMVIRDVATHGTPGGNDNLTGEELLERVQAVIDGL